MVIISPMIGPSLAAIKVIIYDCDGVLIDSRRANAAFYNHILEKFGLGPITPRQLDFVQSSTAREAVDFLFEGTPWRAEAQDYQRAMDNRPFLPLLRLEPHIPEVLAALRPAYHTAIGDAPVDLLVARSAGVIFVAYKNPELEAGYHLQDHRDLLGIL
ncbi:MAG: HAD hydrolase-like protein [Deltaproteobacteria bacterium]|nr:HAD hydrolase-like protein [Deltaproteobacteria bacterium]